jgi:hypothetical protein
MIESSRYLVNQLLHDRSGDAAYDNNRNNLTGWLLRFLQTIAKHDFMEFSARLPDRARLHDGQVRAIEQPGTPGGPVPPAPGDDQPSGQ